MDKIQINIPKPVLTKLRELARRWDKSTSELIRQAIERLLDQVPAKLEGRELLPKKFKTFDLGEILIPADKMRELLSERDNVL